MMWYRKDSRYGSTDTPEFRGISRGEEGVEGGDGEKGGELVADNNDLASFFRLLAGPVV